MATADVKRVEVDRPALLDYFQGAEVALLMAVTIGPRLEEEVNHLFARDEAAKALVLDAAGSAFLRGVGEQVHREAFFEARDEGMTTGPCLSIHLLHRLHHLPNTLLAPVAL